MSHLNEANGNADLWMFRGASKTGTLEYVTPYKICIVVLINELCLLRINVDKTDRIQIRKVLFQKSDPASNYRRSTSMLILNLIQSPDMDFEELLLEFERYSIQPSLIENFKSKCLDLAGKESGSVLEVLNKVESISVDSSFEPLINPSSKVGLFLRRVLLFFEKLSFSQTLSVFEAFKGFVRAGLSAVADISGVVEQDMSVDMDSVVDQSLDLKPSSSLVCAKIPPVGLWSRRQAELFMMNQAKLLSENPEKALNPPQLQAKLRDVISTNPEQAEAHYLSYLNCLRVNEYCGSVDSLFHYFDRKTSAYDESVARCQGQRYAALNLAILQAHFNKREGALTSLKEAITLSHEASDNVCLQHAQAWLYKLKNEDQEVLIQRSISKSEELNLNYLCSLGLQCLAEKTACSGFLPSQVFELINRSEVVNTQYSLMDLLATGLAMKVALWSMYGRSDLAILAAQQLLYLDSGNSVVTGGIGDSLILAITNLVYFFAVQGEYQIGWALVEFGRRSTEDSKWWLWAENVLYFVESLNKGLWQHAFAAVHQLATVDEIEAKLRLCELWLVMGNRCEALKSAESVLKDLSPINTSPVSYIRASLLYSKALPKGSMLMLCQALVTARQHYVDYWAALICLEIANVQLEIGLKSQAMKIVDEVLLTALSIGANSDMSDALVLYAECKIATAQPDDRSRVISEAIAVLDQAADLAKKIENYSKVKKILHLQIVLCDEIGLIPQRNKYSYEFRFLDEQFPTNDSPINSIQ